MTQFQYSFHQCIKIPQPYIQILYETVSIDSELTPDIIQREIKLEKCLDEDFYQHNMQGNNFQLESHQVEQENLEQEKDSLMKDILPSMDLSKEVENAHHYSNSNENDNWVMSIVWRSNDLRFLRNSIKGFNEMIKLCLKTIEVVQTTIGNQLSINNENITI